MVEVLISVLLLSVSVLGLVRALGTSLQDSGDLQYRSEAAALADELVGRMWVDRASLDSYVAANVAVPRLPSGTRTITRAGDVMTVTINWQAPGAPGPSQHQVTATLTANSAAEAPPPPPPPGP
jgi:type IV pilus assembly protein PilV